MAKQPLHTNEMLGTTDEFEAVYETHAKSIYRFLYWRTRDSALSEDLTSSVFEKAWRSRESFHGGSKRAWLQRIARNVLIDHWRKKQDLPLEDADTLQDHRTLAAGEVLDKSQQIQRLQTAVNKLPDEMRAVVNLRFIEGRSSKQVAKQLNLTDSNVRVIQYRALKKLKGYLK